MQRTRPHPLSHPVLLSVVAALTVPMGCGKEKVPPASEAPAASAPTPAPPPLPPTPALRPPEPAPPPIAPPARLPDKVPSAPPLPSAAPPVVPSAPAPPGSTEAGGPLGLPAASRDQVVALRGSRRAFDGAPPAIPHPVDDRTRDCLACHGQPANVGGIRVPTISHPPYVQCRQCHVQLVPTALGTVAGGPPTAASSFQAVGSAGRGARAYPEAPPQIPHPVFMRERCNACHGTYGRQGLRSSHPERVMCQQCHVASTDAEGLAYAPAWPAPLGR